MASHLAELEEALAGQVADQAVRYGDSIKIWAKSAYLKDVSPSSYDPKDKDGGYLGVYEKLDRTSRVLVPPVGFDAQGTFRESVFRLEDPRLQSKCSGEPIRYGDPVVMVDQHGKVWNNKSGGFFEAYLGPRPRGSPGELYISFQKNGRELKTMMYGDLGVHIDVEDSHRYRVSYNQRLTNYKTSSSRVVGGYVCSDGTGYELIVAVHRHTGPPVPSIPVRTRLVQSPVLESISVSAPRNAEKDLMRASPPNKRPVILYGVKPNSTIHFELPGGKMVSLPGRKLSEEREYQAIVKPLPSEGRPLVLNLTWKELATDAKGEDETNGSNSHNPLVLVVTSSLTLILVFTCVIVAVPATIKVLRPLIQTQINVVTPLGDRIAGPNMTQSFAGWVDNMLQHACPDDYDALHDTPIGVVVIAFLVCFLSGLVSPDWVCVRSQNSKSKALGNVEEDTEEEDEDAVGFPSRWSIVPSLEEADASQIDPSDVFDEAALTANEPTDRWEAAGYDENNTPKHGSFQRFLNGENGNYEKALSRWNATRQWRKEQELDGILENPHPKFDVIKKYYPHYYLGNAKNGCPIYIDCPGGVKMKKLKAAGVKLKDLLHHFVYITEFLWCVLEPREDGRTISILDVKGIGFFDFVGEVVDFVKKTLAISQEHYPERSCKIYIINAPGFFTTIYAMVKQFLAPETVKKIGIYKSPPTADMLNEIDADVLPAIYGGNNHTPLDKTEHELILRNTVYRGLKRHNVMPIGDDGKPRQCNFDEEIDESIPDKLHVANKENEVVHAEDTGSVSSGGLPIAEPVTPIPSNRTIE